jgi:hypothetical protein
MPDRSERMWQTAYEMARSGRYSGVDEVAKALQARYPHAPQVLDNKRVRQELDRLCTEARPGDAEGPRTTR